MTFLLLMAGACNSAATAYYACHIAATQAQINCYKRAVVITDYSKKMKAVSACIDDVIKALELCRKISDGEGA